MDTAIRLYGEIQLMFALSELNHLTRVSNITVKKSGNITANRQINTIQCNIKYNGKNTVETLQLTVKTTPYSVA